jgi:hypothetical protein
MTAAARIISFFPMALDLITAALSLLVASLSLLVASLSLCAFGSPDVQERGIDFAPAR